ncbi:MAG: NeuD/PglB/VioB family sugar acetyltransferase [Chloroflexota bacterium]|nr:NeuD/PglB/VioB family sugar acetyltransferase [Chloroflexota bacterium]
MATVRSAPQGADPGRAVTPRPLVVVGGGEHARVVIDAARTRPEAWQVLGLVDPGPATETRRLLEVDHLGDDDDFAAQLARLDDALRPWCVLGFFGSDGTGARGRAVERLGPAARWATVVHERAWVSPSAQVGEGSVVLAGAIVNAGAIIGRHAIVNSGAVVEHDVVLGDQVHVGPGAIIGGGSRAGSGAVLGLGSLVRDHVEVGTGATVGMGAVVLADVAPGTVVAGSPARPLDVARD